MLVTVLNLAGRLVTQDFDTGLEFRGRLWAGSFVSWLVRRRLVATDHMHGRGPAMLRRLTLSAA